MKLSRLTLLLITPLCCWGETNKPVRDYKMIDMQNGLSYALLDVGKTSFTFSVEWPLDMEIPTGTLYLFYKLDVRSGWSWARELVLDPTKREGDGSGVSRFPVEYNPAQRKAIFEIQYKALAKSHLEKEKFERQAFFQVSIAPLGDTGWLPSQEEIEEELAKMRKEREGGAKAEFKMEVEGKSSYLWLYVCILLGALCAVFYFVRRKI